MIVVFDSGIWISAIQFGGTPLAALNRCMDADQIAFCDDIEREIAGVLGRKFKFGPELVSARIQPFLHDAVRIEISGVVAGVCRDPDDDHILECAVKAGAMCIVTGDHDLLVLGEFQGVRIITAREYLEIQRPA